ncbi:MAG TPA: hypothetical protein VJ165_05610 [candidate division Zixibacteria bacterium]|nr:hypothetical protein [candidate division Zixibacteria bacterium]
MNKSILSVVLFFICFWLLTSAIFAQSSVPNLINFQGRLTDASGNPVTDGAHSVTFRLFDVPSGGAALWTEAATPTTSGGLFTHLLGSITPFPTQTLFQDYDSLYLEITADAIVISPRTRLTSVAYSRVAGGLEIRDDNSDTVTLRTNSLGTISIYEDTDGEQRVALGSGTGGELYLLDGSAPSNVTVQLDANVISGGFLMLNQEDGTAGVTLNGGNTTNGATFFMRNAAGASTISMVADLTGTGAVLLPPDAISDFEIDDEPGVASDTGAGFLSLTGGVQTLLSRTITAPTSGYALVIGTVSVGFSHINGTSDQGRFGVSDAAGSFPSNQDVFARIDGDVPSGIFYQAVTVHSLFAISSGANAFYLLGEEIFGAVSVSDRQLTVIFFPTAYGTVYEPLAGAGNPSDENLPKVSALTPQDIAAEQAEADAFNHKRIEQELLEIQAQRAALEERIKKLEEKISQEELIGMEK